MERVQSFDKPTDTFDPMEVAIDLSLPRAGWRERRNCNNTDPDIFFPERANSEAAKAAKKICRMCVVKRDCLAESLDMKRSEDIGIRAELSEKKRRKLRQTRTSHRKQTN